MNHMKRYLLLIFAVFLFGSCVSGTHHQFLDQEYRKPIANATVSILTIDREDLYDTFPDHRFGSLLPEQQVLFDSRLATILIKQTRAEVKGVADSSVFQSAQFELRHYPLKKDSLLIVSPIYGTTLSNSSMVSRFVLILDQFHFKPVQVEGGGSSYAGHESENRTFMYFETRYLIWDNTEGEAAAWGKVTSDRLMYPTQNPTDMYSNLLSDAFYQIVEKSPLVPSCAPFMRYGELIYPCRTVDDG
ncbi:hypothetical protein DDZ15_14245 [Rhodohalobacter mucosus]|uniref:Lipoprotein n=2 Tax=Rhodohalobacter mucosus TaxID=2079485 RepID=A0A316TPW1_9BACT|nr:hypothetical protein DDZ15_14245 [Rhodohalobacter mucosus]